MVLGTQLCICIERVGKLPCASITKAIASQSIVHACAHEVIRLREAERMRGPSTKRETRPGLP